jgi:hypothetical protein
MTKHFDHDGSDPIDSALADMLTEAMSSRHHQLRNSKGSMHDVRMRARRITRRRTAVGAGALVAVGAVGVIAVARNGDSGGGQRFVAGSNGESNDGADLAAGPDGGYWECTGPLGNTAVGMSSVDYDELLRLAGIAAGIGTTVPPAPGPTTTVIFSDTTSTPLVYETTTTLPDEGELVSTTFSVPPTTFPFDPTSTIDLSTTTSSTDPGLAPATTYPPSTPYTGPADGVYYMSDCTYVQSSFDGTGQPATTSYDGPSTTSDGVSGTTTLVEIDTVVPISVTYSTIAPPTTAVVIDIPVATTEIVDTTIVGG